MIDRETIMHTELLNTKNALYVFDIDDTLLRTSAMVHVRRNGVLVKKLTNAEFNTYVLEPGCEFDFTEFRDAQKFHDESQPIESLMHLLNVLVATADERTKIIMNTARADFNNKDVVLNTFRKFGVNMDMVHLHRAGNIPGNDLPAKKKLVYIRQYLNAAHYKRVHMFDDNRTNLHHFLTLANEYPDTTFSPWIVSENGHLEKFC